MPAKAEKNVLCLEIIIDTLEYRVVE
jgi:hypothetical protein